MNLVRSLANRRLWVEMDAAPKSVEATLFFQADRDRYVLNVINYQQELPNIPVHDLVIRVRTDGRIAARGLGCYRIGLRLAYTVAGDAVELTLTVLADFAMVEIALQPSTAES